MVEIDLICYAIKKILNPADSLMCLYLYKYLYVIPPARITDTYIIYCEK